MLFLSPFVESWQPEPGGMIPQGSHLCSYIQLLILNKMSPEQQIELKKNGECKAERRKGGEERSEKETHSRRLVKRLSSHSLLLCKNIPAHVTDYKTS